MAQKLTITLNIEDEQLKAVDIDRNRNLFADISNEEYLAVRILEIVQSYTDRHIVQPQIDVVVADLKAKPADLKTEALKRGLDIDAAQVSAVDVISVEAKQ